MAVDLNYLKTLSPEQGQEYLRQMLAGGIDPNNLGASGINAYESQAYLPGINSLADPYAKTYTALMPSSTDQGYLAHFGSGGELAAVGMQPAPNWYEQEVFGIPIGAMLPFAAAGIGAAFPGTVAGEAAAGAATGAATGGANTALTGANIVAGAEPAVYGITAQGSLTPWQTLQNLYYGAGNAFNVAVGDTPFASTAANALAPASTSAATNVATSAATNGGILDTINKAFGTNITWGDLAKAGITLGGTYLASNASSDALDKAVEAQNAANQQAIALQQPYMNAGTSAINSLATGLAPGGQYATPFSQTNWQQDPGYAFRLSEGLKALDRSAASRGMLLSGAQIKGAQRYGQDMASQEYQNAFNRFYTERQNMLDPQFRLAGMGQTAAANASGITQQSGTNVANANLAQGQQNASLYQTAGNVLSQLLYPQQTTQTQTPTVQSRYSYSPY